MNEKKNVLLEKSFSFALRIVELYKHLSTNEREYVLSRQLLRSGTSVGANVREAQNAESPGDFIHKLGIAQKETDETLYWLELLTQSNYLDQSKAAPLIDEATEILKIIRSSILTTKRNLNEGKVK